MATSFHVPSDVSRFFERYAAAFERHDVVDIAGHYAFPAHIVNDAGDIALVALGSREDWEHRLFELFERYRRIGFASLLLLEINADELSPLLLQARLHWGLRDADDRPLYDFDTTYTLGRFGSALKIVQVVEHNELPRYLACVESRQRSAMT